MGLFGSNTGKVARLDAKADRQLAKVARTGNGSHLARAAELRAKADRAAARRRGR